MAINRKDLPSAPAQDVRAINAAQYLLHSKSNDAKYREDLASGINAGFWIFVLPDQLQMTREGYDYLQRRGATVQ